MSTALGSPIVSPTTRSRLAHLMGFPPSEPAKTPREEDWYIPYNGPIEPPRNEEDTRRGRRRATSNAKSFTSSQGTRSFYGGGGIGEAPVNTAASTRERASMYGTRERASTYDRGSMYSRDGEGERENERERDHRGSIASFLTFGHGMRRRTVVDAEPGFVFPKLQGQGRRSEESHLQGRRSEESRKHAHGRRSDDSTFSSHLPHSPPKHSHTPFNQHPQSLQRGRSVALSLTAADRERDRRREWNARDSMEVSGAPLPASASTGGSQQQRDLFGEPRREWDREEEEEADEEPSEIHWEQSVPRQRTLAHSTSYPVLPSAPMRHPYAVAFPSVTHEPQPTRNLRPLTVPSHAPTNSRSTTSSKPISRSISTSSPKPQQYLHPPATAGAVSPAAIAVALNHNTRGMLRPRSGTISTPNLRGLFSRDKEKTLTRERGRLALAPSSKVAENVKVKSKMQYAAETWCDALMFPRPRFRAHVVSPPESPEDEKRTDLPMLRRTASAQSPPRLDYFAGLPAPPSPRLDREQEHLIPDAPRTPTKQQQRHLLSKPLNRSQTQIVSSLSPAKHRPPHPPATAPPLTPAEETLRRVLAEGELRAKEREAWNEVARTSFQNRRSRSLSRTRSRKKSAPGARVRVESDAAAGSGPRSLAVGLAAEAFRQPTPTISVSVSGTSAGRTSESNAHSRNPSSSAPHGSGHGHTRNTSWGKVALGKLCGPDDPEASPEEKLEGALMSEKTARMSVRGRREEAAEADVQFVDIAPLPARTFLQVEPTVPDRSQSQQSQNSHTSDSLDVPGVGIAISTPPHPSPVEDLPDLSAHPYAQSASPRPRAQPVPISAPYAGPHPTSFDYARSPREQQLHQTHQQVDVKQSPVAWERYKGAGSPSAYAYANISANDKRGSTLGLEEALLSHSFQRGGASAYGNMDEYEVMPVPPPRDPIPPPAPAPAPTPATPRARRKPVALNAYSGIPSLSHTVTSASHTDLPDAEHVHNVIRESHTAMSSPTSLGTASGQTSPRALDDLEPFRDLFYKPGRSGSDSHQHTPSSELRRVLESREDSPGSWSEDRIRSNEGLGGLRALARRRPSYESSMAPQEEADENEGGKRRGYSSQLDGVQEVQLGRSASPLPGLNDESLQLGTPLRAEYEEGQNFPEDIESSRASSIIEHESLETHEETLRLGTVPLAVPETTETVRRQSTALSFGETEDGGSLRPNRDTVATTTSSLGIPGTVEDLIRTSFVTSTSSTSRMSNLIGDFPIPPWAEGITPPSAAALDAYFVPSGDSRVQSHVTDATSD